MTLNHAYYVIGALAALSAYLLYSNNQLSSEVSKLSGLEE